MDNKLAWVGILFIVLALLAVVYFVFDQEWKKITGRHKKHGNTKRGGAWKAER
jgi:cbb3-type cytochrome oxidase subunit 3